MNSIIQATLKTLDKSKALLLMLTDDQLSNNTVSPYYSSIGSHLRHIYDFYECTLNIDSNNKVDLTARKRLSSIENCCESAVDHVNLLMNRLKNVSFPEYSKISVIDDLGDGKIEMDYTVQALLSQANSHAIHHYAIINYILDRLDIVIVDSDFGYNATTPRKVLN